MLVFLMERAIMTNHPRAKIIEVRTRFTSPLLTGETVRCDGRELQQSSTGEDGKRCLMRLICRNEKLQIICLGDVLFSLKGNGNNPR
jgi:hypothetical protein